eukprot:TRINITY_DN7358_c0_g1_i1.p1 TRINITY_DN7358_c0_g1~~TRINITY_DN7358_c0_g1_i1.p1  ORF type:complete len:148 (-),score=11.44 TRINITY_DN7358_c0_g1_i1:176-598(-)
MMISPLKLPQEVYRHDVWRLCISCIISDKVKLECLFKHFPTPEDVLQVKSSELGSLMSTSFNVIDQIKNFTEEYTSVEWDVQHIRRSLGDHVGDVYDIFIKNKWRDTKPNDENLKKVLRVAKEIRKGRPTRTKCTRRIQH